MFFKENKGDVNARRKIVIDLSLNKGEIGILLHMSFLTENRRERERGEKREKRERREEERERRERRTISLW